MNSLLNNNNNLFDYKKESKFFNSNPIEMSNYKFYINKIYDTKIIDHKYKVRKKFRVRKIRRMILKKNKFYLKKKYRKPIINRYLKSFFNYKNIKGNRILLTFSNFRSFNHSYKFNKFMKNIYKLLSSSFKSMYCLISKPIFIITPDKIIIQLFYFLLIPNILKLKKISKILKFDKYFKGKKKIKKNKYKKYKKLRKNWRFKKFKNYIKYRIRKKYRKFRRFNINKRKRRINLRYLSNFVITKIYFNKFKLLCNILSKLFKKPVHFKLIRLHYPYFDNNILVNFIGLMIKKIKIRLIVKRILKKIDTDFNMNKKYSIISSYLTGINIKIGGRMLRQRTIPKRTVKIYKKGAIALSKINFADIARYNKKNKKGAYSITISSGQNLF